MGRGTSQLWPGNGSDGTLLRRGSTRDPLTERPLTAAMQEAFDEEAVAQEVQLLQRQDEDLRFAAAGFGLGSV